MRDPMSAVTRFLMSQLFPGLFPIWDPLSEKERRPGKLITRTAAWISRWYLPRASLTVVWPVFRGRIRAAGKLFWVFFGLSCFAWAVVSLAACLLLRTIAPIVVEAFKAANAKNFTNEDIDLL